MFDANSCYGGEIVGQHPGSDKDDNLQILFDVALESRLYDRFNPDGGSEKLPTPATIQVKMTFRDDERSLGMTMKYLENLGFPEDLTPSALIEGEADYHSLVGKKVFVTPKISGTSMYWNFRFPKRFIPKLDETKSEEVKNKVAEMWRKAKERADEHHAAETIPF